MSSAVTSARAGGTGVTGTSTSARASSAYDAASSITKLQKNVAELQEDIGRGLTPALNNVFTAFQSVTASWDALLGQLQVETPAPGLDLMINAWLPYQSLACRLRGRTR